MSQIRDAAIRGFQDNAGLNPVNGERRELLEQMQRDAFDLIRAIELEISGIRDGDGYWSGCDPVNELVNRLGELNSSERNSFHS